MGRPQTRPERGSWRISAQAARAEPVDTTSVPPTETDVVVIGGGIAGISTALFLNAKGLRTTVLEKGVVAGEQSSRAFGWIYSAGWDLGKLPLTNRAKQHWQSFAERFGEDIGFRRSGNLSLFAKDDDVEQSRAWLKEAHHVAPDIDARLISGDEIDRHIPGASSTYRAALFQASDGTAEPRTAVSRIAKGAMREGVQIIAPCAARTIERRGGRVCGVHTEHGFIRSQAVVIAGGAWSSLFARNAGLKLPQLTISSSMQRLSRIKGALPGAGFGPDFTWCQLADGDTAVGVASNVAPITLDSFRHFFDFLPTLRHSAGLVKLRLSRDFFASLTMKSRWGADEVTPFEQCRILAGRVDTATTDSALANLRRAFPQYERATVTELWAGMIDATPDSTAIVDAVASIPGLYVITGFSGNGLTSAPGAGEMLAEMIAGETPTCDPSIYRLNRFIDGSPFVFRH